MNAETIKNRLDKHFTREGLIQICEKYEITLPKNAKKNKIIEAILEGIPHKKISRIVSFPSRKRITILSVLAIVGLLAGIYVDLPETIKSLTGNKNNVPKERGYSRKPQLDIESKFFRIYSDSLTNECQYSNKYLYLDSLSKKDLEFEEFAKIGKRVDKTKDGVKVNIVNLGATIAKEVKCRWIFDFDKFREAYLRYDTLLKIGIKKESITIKEESCAYSEMFSNNLYHSKQTRYLQPISTIEKKDKVIVPDYFIKLNSIYYNYEDKFGTKKGVDGEYYIPKIRLEIKFKDLNDTELTQEFEIHLRQVDLVQSYDDTKMIRLFELKRNPIVLFN